METAPNTEHPDTPPLDELAGWVLASLRDAGARSLEVPERFSIRASFAGSELSMRPRALRGRALCYGRTARVDGGTRAQVYNAVLVPKLDSTLPIVGLEILSFLRGVHLFVFDFFSVSRSRGGRASEMRRHLSEARKQLSRDFELAPRPEWGREVFSPEAIVVRPDPRRGVRAAPFCQIVRQLLGPYIELLGEDCSATELECRRRRERRARYLEVQAREEPAGAFLERLTGPAWVETFTHQYLYPDWLQGTDRSPPWSTAQPPSSPTDAAVDASSGLG
jgi:hypothetical protein